MIKQLECKDIKEYLKTDTKKVLLDVRTQEEWDQLGKPDGEKLGLKTYFLTIQDENFLDDFNNCSTSHVRSTIVSSILILFRSLLDWVAELINSQILYLFGKYNM